MEAAVGVDIGGTKIKFAVVDRAGTILHQELVPTEAHLGADQVMQKVLAGIERTIAAASGTEDSGGLSAAGVDKEGVAGATGENVRDEGTGAAATAGVGSGSGERTAVPAGIGIGERSGTSAGSGGVRHIAGIGIGSAGQIDYRTGEVAYAVDTLPGWTGMPVKRLVEERFGVPVYVDNDVNVIAAAEQLYGAGRQLRSFVCLALGTGIGGAVVEAGRLVRGAFGGAGELGHVSVDFNGPRCSCGNYGCIELYASGTGIARLAAESAAAGGFDDAAWGSGSSGVLQAWLQRDPHAARIMDLAFRALGTAVGGYIHAFNPEAVIIGGGIAAAGEPFFRALARVVEERTSPQMRRACRIIPASAGGDTGVIGAAAQVWLYGA